MGSSATPPTVHNGTGGKALHLFQTALIPNNKDNGITRKSIGN